MNSFSTLCADRRGGGRAAAGEGRRRGGHRRGALRGGEPGGRGPAPALRDGARRRGGAVSSFEVNTLLQLKIKTLPT